MTKLLRSQWKQILLLAGLLFVAEGVQADTTLSSITPAANDISSEVPALPGRLNGFAWQGIPNVTYSVVLKVDSEPALVVSVGAKILETEFDEVAETLRIDVLYEGLEILADSAVFLPERTFIIAVDPGVAGTGLAASNGCYGPGSNPGLYDTTSNDFGDDDGLADPGTPSTVDSQLGLSSSLPGSIFSTRSFYWCVVPPTAANPSVTFKVKAAPSTQDSLSFTISEELTELLATAGGKSTNAARQFAVSSGDTQVSVAVSDDDDGGVSFSGNPRFVVGEIVVDLPFTNPATAPNAKTLVTRDVSLKVREDISFAPESLRPKNPEVSVSGFIADPEAVGEAVEIVRFQNRRCKDEEGEVFGSAIDDVIGTAAVTGGIVIGRDVVKSDGSYSAKIPQSAIFPNDRKRATLGSRIITDRVQQSKQINLNRNNRDNRR